MYRLRGLGQVTTTPSQAVPLATVSQFAIVQCGFGQKQVDHGPNAPNTCAFDLGTAAAQAWQAPGMMLATFAPSGVMNLSANAYSAIAWAGILAVGWFAFGLGSLFLVKKGAA